jgi:hypothetical protein
MKENGKNIKDSYLIELILARLPSEYHEPCAFYTSMLRSYAFCGKVTLKEIDWGLRVYENLLQEKKAKTEDEKNALAERRAKASSQTLNFGFLEHGLKFTHLGDCASLEDYLGRMFFWRRSLKEHSKEVDDAEFLAAMIKGLTIHYRKIAAHYLMLRSTPSLNKDTLDEFASRLLEIKEEIHRFNYERGTNPVDLILPDLEDFRHRWSPASVMDIDWRIKAYYGVMLTSLLLSGLAFVTTARLYREPIEFISASLCVLGTQLTLRHLARHLGLREIVACTFFVACAACLNHLDLISSVTWLGFGFQIVLPLIVLNGIRVADARGRIKGRRRAKAC